MTSRIVCRVVNLATREVLLGRGHLPVRDRRAYNIALERAEGLSYSHVTGTPEPLCAC